MSACRLTRPAALPPRRPRRPGPVPRCRAHPHLRRPHRSKARPLRPLLVRGRRPLRSRVPMHPRRGPPLRRPGRVRRSPVPALPRSPGRPPRSLGRPLRRHGLPRRRSSRVRPPRHSSVPQLPATAPPRRRVRRLVPVAPRLVRGLRGRCRVRAVPADFPAPERAVPVLPVPATTRSRPARAWVCAGRVPRVAQPQPGAVMPAPALRVRVPAARRVRVPVPGSPACRVRIRR